MHAEKYASLGWSGGTIQPTHSLDSSISVLVYEKPNGPSVRLTSGLFDPSLSLRSFLKL